MARRESEKAAGLALLTMSPLRPLHRAIDLGLNFIDTALGYGDGHSERLVGQLTKERSETIYVATKIPPRTVNGLNNPGSQWRKPFLLSMSSRVQKKALKISGLKND